MNFGFDADQRDLGETVARVIADFPALTAPGPVPVEQHAAVWQALAEIGLFALLVPERYGGVGLGLVDLALAVEALGAGLAPPVIASTLIATELIVRHGSERQQRDFLPAIVAGGVRIAIAVLEADQGYDPAAVATRFADGRLTGTKVLGGDAAAADVVLVVARTAAGTALVAVEGDRPGVTITAHDDLDPASGFGAIAFRDVAVGAGATIGEAGPGRAVDRFVDVAATVHAGLLIGIAGRMLAASVAYARSRVQFGQPIGAFQAIKHRCADMAVAVEAGRSAAYYAFWAATEDAPDRARAASMAKAYCGDVGRQVGNETIQVHGGMGFTWELGLHRYLRRAKAIEHSFGDAAWHNERILAATLAALDASPDVERSAA